MAHLNASRCSLLPSVVTLAAASSSTTSAVLDTHQAKGCIIYVNLTAVSGTTPTCTVTLKGMDPVGQSNTHTVLASTALNAAGLTVLKVYPGLTAAANTVANDVMPGLSRIDVTIGGTTPSFTGAIHVQLVY